MRRFHDFERQHEELRRRRGLQDLLARRDVLLVLGRWRIG